MKFINIRTIGFVAAIALILFTVFQCRKKESLQKEVSELQNVKSENEALIKMIDSFKVETATIIENSPQGIVIDEPAPIFGNVSQIVRTEKELTKLLQINSSLLKRAEEAEIANREALQQLQKGGSVTIETVPVHESLPIVKTEREQVGENYKLNYEIHSYDDLLYTKFDVSVSPNILKVEVPVPGEPIDNTKNNFLGLSGGLQSLNLDDPTDNLFIPLGLMYGRKNLFLDASVITNEQFSKIEGVQAKATIGIRW